jgi:4-amino-4-deoxy-L-arabinose transferase-like glycosyltransferase
MAALGLILALAAWLNVWEISRNGFGNTYYSVAVQSMLRNWYNFFFASYDAGGFITVDKPALGLWVQTASAWLFGFSGFSVVLPEVLAGIGTVAIVYHLARKYFGVAAGLMAALAMAVTPIAVAVSRSNNLDALLTFTLTLAAWAMLRAAETGRLWQLALAVGLVGLGFNIKMLEAFIVLPAFCVLYFFMANVSWPKRVLHLALATVVLAVVSFSWAAIVDLTPTAMRPWVGGSQKNSEFDLILNYNGLGRVTGQGEAFGRGGFGGGSMFNSGTPGIARLFGDDLAGQWSWLFPLLVVGVIAAIWVNRKRLRDARGQYLLLFGGWFVTNALVFSFAQGIFHTYYLVLLGPPVAALLGAGISSLWSAFTSGRWAVRLLLPLALLLTAAWQLHVLQIYPQWAATLAPLLIGSIVAAILLVPALAIMLALRRRKAGDEQEGSGGGYQTVLSNYRSLVTRRVASVVATGALLALLAAPFAWSATTTLAAGNSMMPSAGPTASRTGFGGRGGFGGFPGSFNPGGFGNRGDRNGVTPDGSLPNAGAPGQPGEIASSNLISFLQTNNDGYLYLVAVSSANEASSIALETGQPVLAMGGFSGSDPAMTPEKLQELISSKQLRFVIGGGGFGRGMSSTTVNSWVQSNCTRVDSALYGQQNGSQMYDCAAR